MFRSLLVPRPGRMLAAAALCAASFAVQAAPGTAECRARANHSPERLLECIQTAALWNHLVNFQAIADQNPDSDGHGNRDTGTPGYLASVNYVAALMQQAGYAVTIQTYEFWAQVTGGAPALSVNGRAMTAGSEWFVARHSTGGSVWAPIEAVAGSGTGCAAEDFAGFMPGHVALVPRAGCSASLQVGHAVAAGAAAVVLYNATPGQGGSGAFDREHGAAYPARLARLSEVPVVGVVSNALGKMLMTRDASGTLPVVRIDVPTTFQRFVDYNVIADSPHGDGQHVVVVDAHLDSIYGAGILDNASGSATILEVALNLANTPTRNRLRYIWFGGEELGLHGSAYYTQNLSPAQRQEIAFNIDVDVTATPNKDYLIANPANASNVRRFPPNVVPASQVGTQAFASFFKGAGVPVRSASFGNDGTDSNSFSLIGIPNTGILTQQECCKKPWEVQLWGGSLGNYEGKIPSLDGGCVDQPQRWCDNLSNTDPAVLTLASQASASVVLQMANRDFGAATR